MFNNKSMFSLGIYLYECFFVLFLCVFLSAFLCVLMCDRFEVTSVFLESFLAHVLGGARISPDISMLFISKDKLEIEMRRKERFHGSRRRLLQ